MSRGRVESAAEMDPFYAPEPEKPRVETPATHTVFIVVESSDVWDRIYWSVKVYDTKARAIHLAEEMAKVVHQELGIQAERLES